LRVDSSQSGPDIPRTVLSAHQDTNHAYLSVFVIISYQRLVTLQFFNNNKNTLYLSLDNSIIVLRYYSLHITITRELGLGHNTFFLIIGAGLDLFPFLHSPVTSFHQHASSSRLARTSPLNPIRFQEKEASQKDKSQCKIDLKDQVPCRPPRDPRGCPCCTCQ